MAATKPASEAGITQLTEQLKEQNSNVVKLVKQGEAQLDAQEDAARIAAEAAREAARKGDESPEIAVKVELEDDDGNGFVATAIAAVSGALLGASVGLVAGFLDMWKSIFKFIGGKLSKAFPNISKMLSNTFGKGGQISKFFTSIKTALTENKAFKAISDGFIKFKTTVKAWGTSIAKLFKPVLDIFKGGGSMGKGFKTFFDVFKKFFKAFKGFFKLIFKPLAIIIAVFEGFFEAKDAAGKSEGMMATFFNSIIGFFGGVLDSLVFGMMDLIKDAVSWVAGFFGFKDVEKLLDSFSFSDMFNEFLDDVYAWFNLLFSDPVKALTNLFSKYFGAVLSVGDYIVDMLKKPIIWIMNLFGWDDAAAATEKFSLSGTVMAVWEKVKAWFTGIFSWGKEAGADGEGGWSIMKFVDGIVEKVKGWFTGIFSWASSEDEGDSWIVKTIKAVVTTVKDWFGSMFKFDSASDALGSVLNIMMWIPNLFVKAVAGITSYFAGLLGFDKESEAIANAGKEFSFGDLIMKGLKSLGDWLKGLFDIDVDAIGRSLLGDTVYNALFGSGGKGRKELEAAGIKQGRTDFGKWDVDIKDLAKSLEGMSKAQMTKTLENFKGLAEAGQIDNADEVAGLFKKMMPEIATGGLISETGFAKVHAGELMLDNEAAQLFTKAAGMLSGQTLADLQRQTGQAQGMGTNVVIQTNNSSQINSNASTVMPITPIQPSNSEQQFA